MLKINNFFNKKETLRLSLKIDNRTIERIPEFFFDFYDCQRYVQLTLNLANLKRLGAADLNEFINLETLKIVANELLEIDENSLKQLQKLKNFYLEANNLPLIPKKLFFNLLFLDTLNLVLRNIVLLPRKLVKYNGLLRSLKIECLSNTALDYFNIGGKLEVLHIVILVGSILPTKAAEKILQNRHNISDFKISQFHLDEYESVNTWKFTRLTVIDSSIDMRCLRYFFQNRRLKYANLSYNDGLDFVSVCSKNKHDSLVSLNLKENHILEIKNKAFQKLVNLEILDLSCNSIEEIVLMDMFKDLRNLKVLNLQTNEIVELNVGCLEPLINLEVLNLTQNWLNISVTDICKRLKNLRRLSLAVNFVQTLEFSENYNDHVLEVLDVQDNKIGSIDQTFFYSMINLRYLYLNNNQIESLNRDCFLRFKNLEYLNLSGNLLELLDSMQLLTLSNLKTLKLSNNKIKFLPDNVFANLRRLQLLDLSSNKITEIPPKIFKQNRLIHHLDLSYNSITVIAEDAFRYSNFKCVNLKHNTDLKKSDEMIVELTKQSPFIYII